MLKRGLSGRGSNLLKSDRPLTSRTPGCHFFNTGNVAYSLTPGGANYESPVIFLPEVVAEHGLPAPPASASTLSSSRYSKLRKECGGTFGFASPFIKCLINPKYPIQLLTSDTLHLLDCTHSTAACWRCISPPHRRVDRPLPGRPPWRWCGLGALRLLPLE